MENEYVPVKSDSEWALVSSGTAYVSVRRNLIGLLRETRGAGEFPVPACPGWDVRDAVVHLVGICRNAEANLSPGRAGQSGPGADGLSGLELDALLAEWERSGGEVEAALAQPEHLHKGAAMVMDAFTHELDVRLALGAPFPVGHPAFRGAFEVATGGLSGSVMLLGLPSFRLETEAGSRIVGDGEPVAAVSGSRVDLYRSLTGRRTYQQISQLTWSVDPGPWLPAFRWGPFLPPGRPVERGLALHGS
jgi:uncharacterized protein (TIGR03083 family)